MLSNSSAGGISHLQHVHHALARLLPLFPSGNSRFHSAVGVSGLLRRDRSSWRLSPNPTNNRISWLRFTGPCGHNFCLKCFRKWTVGQGKRTSPKCRTAFPAVMVTNPQINYALVSAIRLAKGPKTRIHRNF
ncbi:unnamed protein product [Microthlaspi erraticum]|uniref:Zinc finger C3HC4 RING-type domain-containing protein n=1 Tax=Microthlaspi erraticum TaxID=1685480 RepID=A0A6D2HJT3_9BRAS|nr:unnamed protein product [Microthlaspi erraticum]